MKNMPILISLFLILFSCKTKKGINQNSDSKTQVNLLLNQWHRDAATFNYKDYLNKMTDNAIFVGTDASEVWSKQEFQNFSKPFFDKKQTWSFKPISRNIYFDQTNQIAWFDELLDTWMGICRGSGVVIFDGAQWKIQHYVLSATIPNENMNEVVIIKKERDSFFLQTMKK
jgi:hypothetical protein